MTETNANPSPSEAELADARDAIATSSSEPIDPGAVGAVLHSHSDKIQEHETRLGEFEAELARMWDAITNGGSRSAKPTPDGATPPSLAVDPETGMAPGHAGAGTGDGPAGYR